MRRCKIQLTFFLICPCPPLPPPPALPPYQPYPIVRSCLSVSTLHTSPPCNTYPSAALHHSPCAAASTGESMALHCCALAMEQNCAKRGSSQVRADQSSGRCCTDRISIPTWLSLRGRWSHELGKCRGRAVEGVGERGRGRGRDFTSINIRDAIRKGDMSAETCQIHIISAAQVVARVARRRFGLVRCRDSCN